MCQWTTVQVSVEWSSNTLTSHSSLSQCVCVFVRPHLGGHFCALDQTCKDLFRILGKSGCTAVFSVLGMHVSVSFRQVLGSEHCSCSVCVWSTAHATTRTLDNLCCETLPGGTFSCPGPNVRGRFFLWGLLSSHREIWTFFLRGLFCFLGKCMCLFMNPRNGIKTCMCVCVYV